MRNHKCGCRGRGCSICCPRQNRVGPTGPQGVPGPTGPCCTGAQGPQGIPGPTGPCCTGPTGPSSGGDGMNCVSTFVDTNVDIGGVGQPVIPFGDLICVDINSVTGCFNIQASFAGRLSLTGTGRFRLTVDGNPVPSSGAAIQNAGPDLDPLTVLDGGAIIRRVQTTPGTHRVCLQWEVSAGANLAISPLAFPGEDHASLVVCDTNCDAGG